MRSHLLSESVVSLPERSRNGHDTVEARARERTAELRRANEELRAFNYSVAHDLRSPLHTIRSYADLLLTEGELAQTTRAEYYARRIALAGQRMQDIIDGLLRLTKLDRCALQPETVDLSALIAGIAGRLREEQPYRTVDIRIESGLSVVADRSLLGIACENLLQNAWKFTAKTAAARIDVGVEIFDGRTVFFVRDNGAGFDMQYADKLFEPLERLHLQTEFPGTGFGLATVRRIVQRHSGEIWAESAPNRGARFYFTL